MRIFKPRKEPKRRLARGLYDYQKAKWGQYTCGPVYDPYNGRLSMGQNGRKPVSESCSPFCHTLYGTRTDKNGFKGHAGPHSMPRDYPRVLRALDLTGPINCTGA